MIRKIKTIILSLSAVFTLAIPAFTPAVAHAVTPEIGKNLCSGANLSLEAQKDCVATEANVGTFQGTLNKIINVISIIVGVVAVIMISLAVSSILPVGAPLKRLQVLKTPFFMVLLD